MLRQRKQMKYCINSLVVLAAANPISRRGSSGTCDGLCCGRRWVRCVPCLLRGAHCSEFSLAGPGMLPIPWLLFWLKKPWGQGNRGSADLCICCGSGVTPPARGRPTGTLGWMFWGRHRYPTWCCRVAAATLRPWDPLAGAGHLPPSTADPTLLPPHHSWHKKKYSFSLFE